MNNIIKALIAIQAEAPAIHKNKVNSFHKYKYADMEAYLESISPLCTKHEVALLFSVTDEHVVNPGHVTVAGTLTALHSSGESLVIHARGEGNDISREGKAGDKATYKAITGFRKYALACMFNIVTTDDPEKEEIPVNGRAANMNNAKPIQNIEGVTIKDVRVKSGTTNNKKWEMYTIVDSNGVVYTTFKKEIAEFAKGLKENNQPATIDAHPSQKGDGMNILGIAHYVAPEDLPFG